MFVGALPHCGDFVEARYLGSEWTAHLGCLKYLLERLKTEQKPEVAYWLCLTTTL